MPDHRPVIIVAGPTASGKSALAIELALALKGEVVNADSMQVYQELSILTARPGTEDINQVPHHLFGTLPAATRCSTGKWLGLATEVIKDIWVRDKLPILVGGTGLYFKALTEGLAPIPNVPQNVVDTAQAHLENIGGVAFKSELAEFDKETADFLPPTDAQRLVRAYAVYKATGRNLSEWKQQQSPGPSLKAKFISVALIPEREKLYDSINRRFDTMIENGALEEAQALKAMNLDPSLPAMKALGIPDLLDYFAGRATLEKAIEKSAQKSRNYAKRQLTWLRHQISPDFTLVPPLEQAQIENLINSILTKTT